MARGVAQINLYEYYLETFGGDNFPLARLAKHWHQDYRSLVGKPFVKKDKGRWRVSIAKLVEYLTK